MYVSFRHLNFIAYKIFAPLLVDGWRWWVETICNFISLHAPINLLSFMCRVCHFSRWHSAKKQSTLCRVFPISVSVASIIIAAINIAVHIHAINIPFHSKNEYVRVAHILATSWNFTIQISATVNQFSAKYIIKVHCSHKLKIDWEFEMLVYVMLGFFSP